ncbi:hypothetical protein ACFQJD_16065 [Haloplanus sp. GCM10025708]|uniref:DUF7537 family lipoprotein n=1 Tax=Haloferacaceae TaxID=1644056 RepID=UPI0036193F2C
MRTLVPVAVAALILLAGCGGGAGPSTATPAPTTETPTPTPTPSPPSPADVAGVNETGANVSTLLAGHRDALTGRSLTLEYTVVSNDTRTTLTEHVAVGGQPLLVRSETGDRTQTTYVANGTTYVRSTQGGESTYNRANRTSGLTHPSSYSGASDLGQFMGALDYEPNGTVVENGTGMLVLEATDGAFNETAMAEQNVTVDTFRSTAYVDRNGVIRKFVYHVEGTRNGASYSYTSRVRIYDVGSTEVPRPDWLDEV